MVEIKNRMLLVAAGALYLSMAGRGALASPVMALHSPPASAAVTAVAPPTAAPANLFLATLRRAQANQAPRPIAQDDEGDEGDQGDQGDQGGQDDQQSPPPVPLGTEAPDFTVTSLDGTKIVNLTELKGQVVLLDFWATWCPPCRATLPETQRFFEQYGNKGLAVMAISDEAAPRVQGFVDQNHYTFPTYLDTNKEANQGYGIHAIPSFAIIDRQGNLTAFFVGGVGRDVILAALVRAGLDVGNDAPAQPAG